MKLVLSISGGGIRGLIPAIILADIENKAGKPISKCFDLIAGTSTGGIIAALLTTPDKSKNPKYSAEEIVTMYKNFGRVVFKQSLFRKVVTLDGLIYTKYNTKPLESLAREYFGETKLCDTLTNIIIPTYQISEKPYPFFFKTYNAKAPNNDIDNPYLWECSRATSAANSYFKPYKADNLHTFLDGGVFANNPSMCAYAQAKNTYGEFEKIVITSIGTGEDLIGYSYNKIKNWGTLQWAGPFLKQTFSSSDETVNYMLNTLTINGDKYYRIQAELDEKSIKMDDASDKNLIRLEKAAKKTIQDNQAEIDNIVDVIANRK